MFNFIQAIELTKTVPKGKAVRLADDACKMARCLQNGSSLPATVRQVLYYNICSVRYPQWKYFSTSFSISPDILRQLHESLSP